MGMLNNAAFYHESLKRYTLLFGTLFNEITISKTMAGNTAANTVATVVRTVKVPLSYGPKEKFLVRAAQDPGLKNPVEIDLPRMSFEIQGMTYAPDRKLATIGKLQTVDPNSNGSSATQLSTVWNPVPYDINFQLNIMVRTYDEGCAILEQILPFFTPEWTNSLMILDDVKYSLDVPIVLVGVSNADNYEGDFQTRTALVWTLDFILKGTFFGPTATKKQIKIIKVAFNDINSNNNMENILIEPGLKTDGTPTNNITLAINPLLVGFDDDWGYIVQVTAP
jgi:hypothetical protein